MDNIFEAFCLFMMGFQCSEPFWERLVGFVEICRRFVRFWVDFEPVLGTHVGASSEAKSA